MLIKFLKSPRFIGTIIPSSRFLAEKMALEAQEAHKILELGAGTGPVTRALCEKRKDLNRDDFVSVELCAQMGTLLQERHPEIKVCCEDAASVLKSLCWADTKTAIVSSLPFRALPKQVVNEIVSELYKFLEKNKEAWVVQFSYVNAEPFEQREGWQWEKVGTVMANFPPAHVWVLRHC